MGVLRGSGGSVSPDGLVEEPTLGVPEGSPGRLDEKAPLASGFLLGSLAFCSGVAAKGEGGPRRTQLCQRPWAHAAGLVSVHRGGAARAA